MSYETRAYDNSHGDPVVVLVASGTHDVSRLVHLLAGASPNCEQIGLGQQVLRQVKRHNAGRAALRLLRDHGGPDFTEHDDLEAKRKAKVADELTDALAAIERVRARCDAVHTASQEWDVSARPGGYMHCCHIRALLDGDTTEEGR